MLEAARQACPESPFIHMSTNKVYGDPTQHDSVEGDGYALGLPTTQHSEHGAPEDFSIDPIETLPLRTSKGCFADVP